MMHGPVNIRFTYTKLHTVYLYAAMMCKGKPTIPSIALGRWNSDALFTVRYELKFYILLYELDYSKGKNRNWITL